MMCLSSGMFRTRTCLNSIAVPAPWSMRVSTEPTNIPPLEALAIGCPVALSAVTGMTDQVGDAALLFNPDSVEEIADCIRRLWIDDKLCAELAERGKRRALNWGQKQFNERLREIVTEITDQESSKK